ncbi:Forkhead protein [Yarrowia sp. C11]|nr:Forkhead protein [Yarrowia sp. E02]KAG5373498.1 Forkhead protein [Yarrowia sp. C11]
MDEGITPIKYNTSALPTLNSNLLKSLSSVHLPPPPSTRAMSSRTSSSKMYCYTPESSQGKQQRYNQNGQQQQTQADYSPHLGEVNLSMSNVMYTPPSSQQRFVNTNQKQQHNNSQQQYFTPTVPQSMRYKVDKENVPLYSPDLKASAKPPQPFFCVDNKDASSNSASPVDAPAKLRIPEPNEFPEIVDEGTKPPFSYAQLIGMAILRSPNRKLTLSQIYEWINTTFKWYSQQKSGWQNSIRHNLSLNKAFKKQERPKSDPGKGNYWLIEHGMEQQFLKERINKKAAPQQESRYTREAMSRSNSDSMGQGSFGDSHGPPPSQFMGVMSPFKATPMQSSASQGHIPMHMPTQMGHPAQQQKVQQSQQQVQQSQQQQQNQNQHQQHQQQFQGLDQSAPLHGGMTHSDFSHSFSHSHSAMAHGLELHAAMHNPNLQSPLRLKKPDDSTDDEEEDNTSSRDISSSNTSNMGEPTTDAILLQTPQRGSVLDQLRTPEKSTPGKRRGTSTLSSIDSDSNTGSDGASDLRPTALARSVSEQSYPFATPVRKSLGLDSLKHFSSTSLSLDSPTRGKHSLDDLDMYPMTHSAKRRMLNSGRAAHMLGGGVSLGTLKLDAQSQSMMPPTSWSSGTSFGYSSMTEFSFGRYGNSPVRGGGSRESNALSAVGSAALSTAAALSPVRNGGLTLAPLTPATTLAPPVSSLPSFTSPRFRSPLHKSVLSGSPQGSLMGPPVTSRELDDLAHSPSSRRVQALLDEDDHISRACFGSPGKRAARSQQFLDHSVLFEHSGDHVDVFGVDVCQVVRRAVENGGADGGKNASAGSGSWDSIDFRRMIIEEGIRLDSPIKTQDGYRIGLSPSRLRR